MDATALGEELGRIVKVQIAQLESRFEAQIQSLKAELAARPDPEQGIAGVPGRDGEDGTSVTIDDVLPALQKQVDEFLNAMPVPEDGKDGQCGKDGASVLLEDVLPTLEKQVQEHLDAIPAPKDGINGAAGASVTIDDVLPALTDHVDSYLKSIPSPKDGLDGKDGVNLAGAMIDRDGVLNLTLSNGEIVMLGMVLGKDGRDGSDGADGRDGLGFEDLEFDTDESGRAVAKFRRGDVEKSVALPGLVYRGPYKAEVDYLKGDAVSFGGSIWIATDETSDRPQGGSAWQLSVKKGRDGRTPPPEKFATQPVRLK